MERTAPASSKQPPASSMLIYHQMHDLHENWANKYAQHVFNSKNAGGKVLGLHFHGTYMVLIGLLSSRRTDCIIP